MRIIRVFPNRTNATPMDDLVRFSEPGIYDEADEIHVSVTFTWGLKRAEYLANQWKMIAPVKIGGPATGMRGEQFEPGMYLKKGYVITSRGCPNKCWFCDVWKREGDIRELEIKDGWNVLDDNLLACSDQHIKSVFKMLRNQNHLVEFTGGFEAKRLKGWHINELLNIKLKQMFFAYDTTDDYEPLVYVARLLKEAGYIKKESRAVKCYVLVGYPKDTFERAEQRLQDVMSIGMMPMAMLYRDYEGKYDINWRRFQREWANSIIVGYKMKYDAKTH